MAVGLVREAGNPDPTGYTGEIWVDELKVDGIKQFNGWSSRLSLQTQWADFLSLSGGLDYQSGDFRTMTDTKTSLGDSKVSGNLSLSSALDKFMPREWGVSIPIGASITSSLSRPQLKPNTDMYLSDNNQPDGFLELARDVISRSSEEKDITGAEHFETQSYGQSFFINYSKSGTPPNPAVDLLLNRISSQFQYSMNTNHTRRGLMPSGDEDYINFDTSRNYSGGLKYDLTPRDPPSWTRWKPLGENKATWIPARFKEIEFSMLPGSATLDLANARYSSSMMRQHEPGIDMPPRGPKSSTSATACSSRIRRSGRSLIFRIRSTSAGTSRAPDRWVAREIFTISWTLEYSDGIPNGSVIIFL